MRSAVPSNVRRCRMETFVERAVIGGEKRKKRILFYRVAVSF